VPVALVGVNGGRKLVREKLVALGLWSVALGAVVLGEELAALAGAVGVAGEGEDLGVVD
jgi:hypothetical protein